MVSQSDLFGSWPLLMPQKVKIDPNMGPKGDIFGPQNVQNGTCCQPASKRKLYNNSNDSLLYLIINKLYCHCFGVSRSIKIRLQFDVNLEMDKNSSWSLQEAETIPMEICLDDLWPQVIPR